MLNPEYVEGRVVAGINTELVEVSSYPDQQKFFNGLVMIEVEIRGRLSDVEYKNLLIFLKKKGEYLGRQEREMYLLYDYPGFDLDPTKREVDIRLRSTNGECEIMLKEKNHNYNVARKEISLKIVDKDLKTAKKIVKAFGCKKALKMNRIKELFDYQGIE